VSGRAEKLFNLLAFRQGHWQPVKKGSDLLRKLNIPGTGTGFKRIR
jgi:hypothetical protein